MKKVLSVSIGIPAYNEEANIGKLISQVLSQKQTGFRICEILIMADGCSDKTVKIIKSFKNPIVRLFVDIKRKGQQYRQNQILNRFRGNVLVLVEADTLPLNNRCLNEVLKPFLKKQVKNLGMVVGQNLPIPPKNFFEKIMFTNTMFQRRVLYKLNNGNNLFILSGGHSLRALNRQAAKELKWPLDAPEDAYCYLRLKELGYKVLLQKNAISFMRNVTHIKDRIRQNTKFLSGRESLKKYFGEDTVEQAYHIPKKILLKVILLEIVKNPIWTSLSVFEFVLTRINVGKVSQFSPLYQIYQSSKKLDIDSSNLLLKND